MLIDLSTLTGGRLHAGWHGHWRRVSPSLLPESSLDGRSGKKCSSRLIVGNCMDKLQVTGQNAGRVFNFRSGHLYAEHFWCFQVKLPNLKLKTRPKQLWGSLPLVIALPGNCDKFYFTFKFEVQIYQIFERALIPICHLWNKSNLNTNKPKRFSNYAKHKLRWDYL
jgi:hypothetical protein